MELNVTSLSKEPFVSVIATHCKYGRSSIGISVLCIHVSLTYFH